MTLYQTLLEYIPYLACNSLTPYLRICSWWHRETALRLPKRRQFTYFGDIWCISQSSQQARPYQKKSKLPLKNWKLSCLRYYNPRWAEQSIPSPNFLWRLPNLSTSVFEESRWHKPQWPRFPIQSKTYLNIDLFVCHQTKPQWRRHSRLSSPTPTL